MGVTQQAITQIFSLVPLLPYNTHLSLPTLILNYVTVVVRI